MPIPASQIVDIIPGVIGGGGSALALNGVILTQNTAVPIGSVMPFTTSTDVDNFFGASSNEALLAAEYFQGYNNATALPGQLLFVQYPENAVAAYLRGGSVAALTLTALKALAGALTLTVDGTPITSSAINLTAATSFSDAATIIQAAFTTPPFSVTYDAQRTAFLFTTTLTGSTATIGFASDTLAAGLMLTQATGAVTSQGAAAASPSTFMGTVTAVTQNWVDFMTVWNASTVEKEGFAEWTSQQNNRYGYVMWSSDAAATVYPDTTTALANIIANNYSGTVGIYCSPTLDPNGLAAAFVLGTAAAIDFTRKNGRITFAFKYLDGIPASVMDPETASNLELNGYNFVGQYATANQGFTFFYPGSVTGKYDFFDEFLNQVYLNSQLQLAILELYTNVPSIPYNSDGYGLIHAACMDPIDQALNFGSIRPGVTLSASQAAQVNNAAGMPIDQVLRTRGWYLQILDASAQVRAARGSPPMTLWYMDGGAVQQANLASIVVQ